MRPSQIVTALNYLIDANQPVMIHGSPGVGKSDIVRQVAKQRGIELIDLRLSQLDPVDLRGVPSVDTKKRITSWNPPSFLPTDGKGILFLDEINSAAQATQAAAYQLVLDRKLGDYVLPPGWAIIAAGNRSTDRAIVNQMSTALKNRFTHINFEVNLDDWCDWALRNNIAIEVLGFIRFRPMLLNEFEQRNDSKEERERVQRLKDAQAFATPRSWEFLSKVIQQKPSANIEYELYSGIVGEGAAAEFMGYLKYYRDLPNLDALLMNPGAAKVPEEPATLYALATGLATKATQDNMERVVQYTLRLPAEFQVLLMKDAITRDNSLTQTKAFNDWAVKNSDVLF
ncbi:MAG: ATPase [Fimbriimonadales bacterium]|nr:MAG: ATPase [Fimbriimonadales bacterium]